MRTVSMREARAQFSRLVAAVESGAEPEIVFTRKGKPVAKLVPLDEPKRTTIRLGLLAGKYPPMSLEDFNAADEEIAKLFLGDDS